MRNRDLIDIVSDLVGPIFPSNDPAIDTARRDNLKEYIELFQSMAIRLHDISARKDSPCLPTRMMGNDAYKVMKEMIDYFSKFYKQEND